MGDAGGIFVVAGGRLERIQLFKKHFGCDFEKGFLWKMPLSKIKYFLYMFLLRSSYFIRFKNYKGDIIDQELKRTDL